MNEEEKRKYYYRCDGQRRFSDECHPALYIRTSERRACNNEADQYSHFADIGALCETCMQHPFANGIYPKATKQSIVLISNAFHSIDCSTISSTETIVEKFCRICHSFGSFGDPLISPCRCTGSLKYVHISCLLHWLTICAHKLKRPIICELCRYKYRLRNTIDWQNLRLPSISRRDLRYLIVFIIAVALMLLSSVTTLTCFYIERNLKRNDTMMDDSSEAIMDINGNWESLLSLSSTLLSVFFLILSLCVAIYAHIKTNTSLIKYLYRLWVNNQNWKIEEYQPGHDQRYCHKMEQLRKRLNGKIK
ncbi:unnamed protein product [Litomosoides sigmodontis]|uniref:RING-CH-type domain-containing protein n=1 Tax=Litomosoides sigmodontis TaxID=42156 RepID=A0A3P6U2Y3_LITSI|nr:unnamed protein product [Litomosoides sigmodontis]